METLTATRLIALDTAHNVRHIGGYRTRDGRRTSEHFIRSSGLHRLTPESLGHLRERGLLTVIDLRSGKEREEFPTPELAPLGIHHVFAPVFESDASPTGLANEFPGYATVYRTFLETGREAYRTVLETVATTGGGLLYHCAVGKDRTGVATALLLDLVGVDDEQIIADFSESAANLAPMLPQWKEGMATRGMNPDQAETMMASNPEDMASLLAHLRDTWGSAEGYFRDLGITTGTLDDARARLLA